MIHVEGNWNPEWLAKACYDTVFPDQIARNMCSCLRCEILLPSFFFPLRFGFLKMSLRTARFEQFLYWYSRLFSLTHPQFFRHLWDFFRKWFIGTSNQCSIFFSENSIFSGPNNVRSVSKVWHITSNNNAVLLTLYDSIFSIWKLSVCLLIH